MFSYILEIEVRDIKKMMHQYWFISYNKCTTLMQDVNNKIN